jgi:pimeloyl-ACP methyl ester carboxylesterase
MTHAGALPSGSRYAIEVPDRWNGVLLLGCHPVPVAPGEPPWRPDDTIIATLVRHGYAVAGSANTIFWPLERVLSDQPVLLDIALDRLGPARHVIAFGLSIGGIICAGAVQRFPERLSGAIPMCGNLAGAVANQNRELDIAFAVKALLAPGTPLELTGIRDSQRNLALAKEVLHEAQSTAPGRARLAFAAAVGDVPGWQDPESPEPAPDDFEARERQQAFLFEDVAFLVFFLARKQVEMQAGGNPSWNTDVDYRKLFERSGSRDGVTALYRSAGLDLEADFDTLERATRIEADHHAVRYLEKNIVFDGDLGGVPVLTLHTDCDGLVPAAHERAYADVVRSTGQSDLLRQLFVHRAGHCTFTMAEMLTALEALAERVEGGSWPDLSATVLNRRAEAHGEAAQLATRASSAQPAFVSFEPRAFTRPYDARDAARYGSGSARR